MESSDPEDCAEAITIHFEEIGESQTDDNTGDEVVYKNLPQLPGRVHGSGPGFVGSNVSRVSQKTELETVGEDWLEEENEPKNKYFRDRRLVFLS